MCPLRSGPGHRREWSHKLCGGRWRPWSAPGRVRVRTCRSWGTTRTCAEHDAAWQELGTVIARRGWQAEAARPLPPAIRFPGDPPRIWSNKERDRDFTGRGAVLAALFRALIATPSADTPRVCVLQGGPGLGKTSIATEYGHRYRSYYDAVWGSVLRTAAA